MEIITPQLQEVNTGSRSILPTGRLKIENGKVLQEAEAIVHKKCQIMTHAGLQYFELGIYKLWFSVPIDFIKKIRSELVRVFD